MNILMVDDEVLALQGLLDDINWDLFGFEEILTANSYAQAINILVNQKVDILLCDIEMPFGNGIELVRWVKEHSPYIECIFLTCHDSFQFVRQALFMECLGYILKPAESAEVELYLKKAQNKILARDEAEVYENYGKMYLHNLKESAKSPGTVDAVETVEEYIRANISESLGVEELARMVYMSSAHLGRLFHRKYGMSLIDYITERRIEMAKELLKDKSITVSAVAAKSGYRNYSYFTKMFKKCTGKTPREYRKEIHT